MKLNTLSIKNYRCFSNLEVALDDRLTLIVGNNGAGKSSILDAAVVACGTFVGGFDSGVRSGIQKEDVHRKYFSVGSQLESHPQFPCDISASGEIGGQPYSWTRSLRNEKGRTTIEYAKGPIQLAKSLQDRIRTGDTTVILPVVCYYGTARLWSQKKVRSDLTKGAFTRLDGYVDCLNAAFNEKLLLKWFERQTMLELQMNVTVPEFQAVRTAVTEFFQQVTGCTDGVISYSIELEGLEVQYTAESGAPVKHTLQSLSDGYREILRLVADLAYRMAVLNPQFLGETIHQTPGVVMIDEVDLHLHPKWQQKILAALTIVFPKVQFLVTTHAPAVIQSVEQKHLRILDQNNQLHTPATTTYGRDVNSILREIMCVSDRPIEVQNQFDQFSLYLENGEIEQAKHTLHTLLELLGEGDPDVISAQVSLDLEEMDVVEDRI